MNLKGWGGNTWHTLGQRATCQPLQRMTLRQTLVMSDAVTAECDFEKLHRPDTWRLLAWACDAEANKLQQHSPRTLPGFLPS